MKLSSFPLSPEPPHSAFPLSIPSHFLCLLQLASLLLWVREPVLIAGLFLLPRPPAATVAAPVFCTQISYSEIWRATLPHFPISRKRQNFSPACETILLPISCG